MEVVYGNPDENSLTGTGWIGWSPDFQTEPTNLPLMPRDFSAPFMPEPTQLGKRMIEDQMKELDLVKQIEKDSIFMKITHDYAEFSKCTFTKVGAIAVNENDRIIATGVNGTLPGQLNCCQHHFAKREDHVPFTQKNEIHAEANLLLEMIKSQVGFKKLTIYITISPCYECLKLLLGLNRKNENVVQRIVYGEKYHRTSDDEMFEMIRKSRMSGTSLEKVWTKDF